MSEYSAEYLRGYNDGCTDAKENLEREAAAPRPELVPAHDRAAKEGEGLKVEEGRVTDELQPTYFVKHPDGSFSIANPQPKAIIPKFSTYEVWTESLPKCVGYEGKCDGDLVGELHEPHCPMHGKEFATLRDAFNAGAGR